MKLSAKAQGQYRRLVINYEGLERSEAISNLNVALKSAVKNSEVGPTQGFGVLFK
jgi:hypothetical protein